MSVVNLANSIALLGLVAVGATARAAVSDPRPVISKIRAWDFDPGITKPERPKQ